MNANPLFVTASDGKSHSNTILCLYGWMDAETFNKSHKIIQYLCVKSFLLQVTCPPNLVTDSHHPLTVLLEPLRALHPSLKFSLPGLKQSFTSIIMLPCTNAPQVSHLHCKHLLVCLICQNGTTALQTKCRESE